MVRVLGEAVLRRGNEAEPLRPPTAAEPEQAEWQSWVLDALQTDELCPCNWSKGEETIDLQKATAA